MFIDPTGNLAPTAPSLPTSVGVAIFFGYILDLLKRLKFFPKINYYSVKLNIIIRVVLSGFGTLGISWAWSKSGNGNQLSILLPAWSVLILGIWHWAVQYGMQDAFEQLLRLKASLLVIPPQPPSTENNACSAKGMRANAIVEPKLNP
jgi:hypothetical protein